MKKRILSVLLVVCMLVSMVPTVFAADAATENAAEVGGVGYKTFVEALNAAAADQTIVLMSDVTLEEQVTIEKNVTLDLNGKTLSGSFASDYGMLYVKKGISLTVTDSAQDGKITSSGSYAIGNYGTVTINGGVVESTADGYAALYNFYYSGTAAF